MHVGSKAVAEIYYLLTGLQLGKERRKMVSLAESSLWGLVSRLLMKLQL